MGSKIPENAKFVIYKSYIGYKVDWSSASLRFCESQYSESFNRSSPAFEIMFCQVAISVLQVYIRLRYMLGYRFYYRISAIICYIYTYSAYLSKILNTITVSRRSTSGTIR